MKCKITTLKKLSNLPNLDASKRNQSFARTVIQWKELALGIAAIRQHVVTAEDLHTSYAMVASTMYESLYNLNILKYLLF